MTFFGKTISLEDVPKDTDAVLLTLRSYRELERLLNIYKEALEYYAEPMNWFEGAEDLLIGGPFRAMDALKEASKPSQSE